MEWKIVSKKWVCENCHHWNDAITIEYNEITKEKMEISNCCFCHLIFKKPILTNIIKCPHCDKDIVIEVRKE